MTTSSDREHWIPLEGTFNTRDLGGWPLPSGRSTKRGVLVRSDTLDNLTASDVSTLVDTLGVRQVIDLRSSRERAELGRGPLAEVSGVHYTELDVASYKTLGMLRRDRAAARERGEDPYLTRGRQYAHILYHGAQAYREAIDIIVEQGGTPAVFFCAAGKDRTGILAALILHMAGVQYHDIVADYVLTDDRMPAIVQSLRERVVYVGIDDPAEREALRAHPSVMAHFRSAMGEIAGSGDDWLAALGIRDDAIASLRQVFAT